MAVRALPAGMQNPQVRKSGKSRSLAPREHGAYGQVSFPLLVALASGTPSAAALLLTGGAVFAFVAHEPVLIAIGRRGQRALETEGRRALQWSAAFTGAAALFYASGAALAPAAARWALLGCAVLVALAGGLIARNAERTLLGELLVGATLPALAVPVAACSGSGVRLAVGVWLTWTLGSAAATWAVRDTIAHLKLPRSAARRVFPIALVAASAFAAFAAGALSAGLLAFTLPMVLVSLAVAVRPPHPRHLKKLGWTLVAASAVTAAGLIVIARIG